MGKFLKYLEEGERIPIMEFNADYIDLENPKTVVAINSMLAQNTDQEFLTPYIALGRVMQVIAQYGLHLPKMFLDGESGSEYVELIQHGKEVVDGAIKKYLYLEYRMNQSGKFDIFVQIVSEDELEEILSMEAEDDNPFDAEIDVMNDKDNIYHGMAEGFKGPTKKEIDTMRKNGIVNTYTSGPHPDRKVKKKQSKPESSDMRDAIKGRVFKEDTLTELTGKGKLRDIEAYHADAYNKHSDKAKEHQYAAFDKFDHGKGAKKDERKELKHERKAKGHANSLRRAQALRGIMNNKRALASAKRDRT